MIDERFCWRPPSPSQVFFGYYENESTLIVGPRLRVFERTLYTKVNDALIQGLYRIASWSPSVAPLKDTAKASSFLPPEEYNDPSHPKEQDDEVPQEDMLQFSSPNLLEFSSGNLGAAGTTSGAGGGTGSVGRVLGMPATGRGGYAQPLFLGDEDDPFAPLPQNDGAGDLGFGGPISAAPALTAEAGRHDVVAPPEGLLAAWGDADAGRELPY